MGYPLYKLSPCVTMEIKTEKTCRPLWSTPGKTERLQQAVKWSDFPGVDRQGRQTIPVLISVVT